MELRKGTIQGLTGSWNSGIATIYIKDAETAQIDAIPCENTSTVRNLDAVYGNVITSGHRVNLDSIKGKEIYWSLDEMGLMLYGFTPVEEMPPMGVKIYEKHRAERMISS